MAAELQKVVWPSSQAVRTNTSVVLWTCAASVAALAALDAVASRVIALLFG
jgi:preprotein translocase SecE subunit